MADAFNNTLYGLINEYRIQQGRVACQIDLRLEKAAGLHIEWLAASAKKSVLKQYPKSDHNTNCQWLLKTHPELNWAPILAAYQGVYPVQLGAFDLAKLCGYYGGLIGDTGYFGGKNPSASEVLEGWKDSPTLTHWAAWPLLTIS